MEKLLNWGSVAPWAPLPMPIYTYEIVSILFYYLIKCIFGSWTVPNMVATLLFIVHLIQTEAVPLWQVWLAELIIRSLLACLKCMMSTTRV